MNTINIAGTSIGLIPVKDNILDGLPIDIYVRFKFFEGHFKDVRLLFLKHKNLTDSLTPAKCRKISVKISAALSIPVAFIFEKLQPIVRRRMVEQGVFFVISGKYAFLPNLFVNTLESKIPSKVSQTLSSTAQYIFLYYMQRKECRFSTIREIQDQTTFSYLQIVRAIKELECSGLCESEYIPPKEKRIQFQSKSRGTWNKAVPFLRNPVKRTVFTDDEIHCMEDIRISGCNALAHYSDLNPVRQRVMALSKKTYMDTTLSGLATNPVEGNTVLQEWAYPPTILDGEYVDPLSLWLSLKDNQNPRIRIALDHIIDNMTW